MNNFELPRVQIVEQFEISREKKKIQISKSYEKMLVINLGIKMIILKYFSKLGSIYLLFLNCKYKIKHFYGYRK